MLFWSGDSVDTVESGDVMAPEELQLGDEPRPLSLPLSYPCCKYKRKHWYWNIHIL